ncbi:MAG TPA: alpha/beta hydrolase [Ktedonobacteraceae bacterium]|nr:alpha/beta hydrolase [Ktedonobacteraceae bacterium]
MRTDIAFNAEGTVLRGWLYLPEQGPGAFPLVVMAHGWAAVKEMYLDVWAEAFARVGIAVLVYDHRNFGASDGTPRQEIDPWAQVRDYRHAITFAETLPQIDRQRIGIWGTSYSGGHALIVSALDRRVTCVVAQAPTISGWHNTLRRFPADTLPAVRERFRADREARFHGEAPATVPVIADFNATDVGSGVSSLSDRVEPIGNDARKWPLSMPYERLGGWRNEITLRSLESYSEYEPGTYIERIAPTPLLIIAATEDTVTPTDEILAAYARAHEPRQIKLVPGGHYDIYGMNREVVITTAREWFIKYLQP